MNEDWWIVVTGSFVEGFKCYGPFTTKEAANRFCEAEEIQDEYFAETVKLEKP